MSLASRKRANGKLRTALAPICLVGCLLNLPASRALAAGTKTVEGSTLTHRADVDSAYGEVYIYTGGAFLPGTHLASFTYLYDFAGQAGNSSGYITPLLFARQFTGNYVLYTVVGIGKWSEVEINAPAQEIPFDVVEGIKVPTNGDFTFGYVNAIVDASGVQLANSAGTVDNDEYLDGGEGVGGAGTTNNWAVSAGPAPSVNLGATFGDAGSGADYSFFSTTRTYSAEAAGIVATP